jgi:hypothetical protein
VEIQEGQEPSLLTIGIITNNKIKIVLDKKKHNRSKDKHNLQRFRIIITEEMFIVKEITNLESNKILIMMKRKELII